MFETLIPLSPKSDAATKFSPAASWEYTKGLPSISITLQEIEAVANEYAIVFTPQAPVVPVALLGLNGQNNYVDDNGGWKSAYVPARLRVYPFATVASSVEDTVVVVRDVEAPHFKQDSGIPLFDADGQPSALLKEIEQVLLENQQGMNAIAKLSAQLVEAGVVQDIRIDVTLPDGTPRSFDGFKAVNNEAAAALDATTRAALEQSGAWKLLELHRLSMKNFGRLL